MNKPKILIFILSLSIITIAATGFMITKSNAGPCTGFFQVFGPWPIVSIDMCYCTNGAATGQPTCPGLSAGCCGTPQTNCAGDIPACPR